MANRVHKTSSGDTLTSLASTYHACKKQNGSVDDLRAARVIATIRTATAPVTDLSSYSDTADLGANKTILIPTTRHIAGALFAEPAALATVLTSKGIGNAERLLAYSTTEILAVLGTPSGWTSGDLTRSWAICSFLDLDGMDVYTAKHLYDTASITTLDQLKAQTPASITTILNTLIASPHNRPAELANEGHSDRWPMAAWIRRRVTVNELDNATPFAVPVSHVAADAQAAFYEANAVKLDTTPEDAELSAQLALLYRFQATLLRANAATLAGRSAEAASQFAKAKAHFHRLAERTGASSSPVDDEIGLNFNAVADTVKRLLEKMPAEEDHPLGAPRLTTLSGRVPTRYRLRGFRYSELSSGAKTSFQGSAIAGVAAHKLPRKMREAVGRSVQAKTRNDLATASSNASLTSALLASPTTAAVRDLEAQDKAVMRRNLASVTVADLFAGAGKLDLFDAAGFDLPISDVAGLIGSLWSANKPDDVLSTAAKAAYPTAFITDTSLKPMTRFVAMPDVAGSTIPAYVAVDSSFTTRLKDVVFKPRSVSVKGADVQFEAEAWASAGSFALVAAHAYGTIIPMGLLRAWSALGSPAQAQRHGGSHTTLYAMNGSVLVDLDSAVPGSIQLSPALYACSTDWGTNNNAITLLAIDGYVQLTLFRADGLFANYDYPGARRVYEDIMCAIEKAAPNLADDGRLALRALSGEALKVLKGTSTGDLDSLSPFRVSWGSGGSARRFGDSFTRLYRRDPSAALPTAIQDSARWFYWTAPPVENAPTLAEGMVLVDDDRFSMGIGGPFAIAVDNGASLTARHHIYYMRCLAKIAWIDMMLNSFGYTPWYIPPWSFDALYGIARDLGNRALEMEAKVFSLMQAAQQQATSEFQAGAAVAMTDAQLNIARSRSEEAKVAVEIANKQADLAARQEAQQAAMSLINGLGGSLEGALVGGLSLAAGGPGTALIGAATSIVGGLVGMANAASNAESLSAIATDTETLGAQQLATAGLEVAAALLSNTQASAYEGFLDSLKLTSSGYERLIELARDTHNLYLAHANRTAWLAQRALIHETRQPYDIVKTWYGQSGDELYNVTQAQRLVADLETLRAVYVTGQTERRQEVKWVVPLSRLCPGALQYLRDNGETSFCLSQEQIDMSFPGLSLHGLKDVQVAFLGTLPATGVSGVLSCSGLSRVRVPNQGNYLDGSTITPDWVTTGLDATGAVTGRNTVFDNRARYAMKTLVAQGAAVSLSAFDVRTDRAVLQVPQGMLGPLQHVALDSMFSLAVFRQAAAFDFADIVDVELTFWFLANYDAELAREQYEVLFRRGLANALQTRALASFAADSDGQWSAFRADTLTTEELDLRRLWFRASALPAYETTRLITNLLLAIGRDGTSSFGFRLCSNADPVGVALTFGATNEPLFTAVGGTLGDSDPDETSALLTWVENKLYSGVTPTSDPTQTAFVLKIEPALVGADWLLVDDDGALETTTSGPLVAPSGGTATCSDGTSWNHVSVSVKVALQGGTVRIRVRSGASTAGYGLEISSSEVRFVKNAALLGTARSLSYPTAEYLAVEVRCWTATVSGSDTVYLEAWIDGLRVLTASESPTYTAGTVMLEQIAGSGSQFDDVVVRRLTKRGVDADLLLSEPFTSTLPTDWTFGGTWTISGTGHNRLDLTNLLSLALQVDYRFQMTEAVS